MTLGSFRTQPAEPVAEPPRSPIRQATQGHRFDVELVSLVKRYGDTVAVDGISLRIPRGSYCCLLGPSGCGKSTTLRMLAGHEAVSEGNVLIHDAEVTNAAPVDRGTSMMFQSYALFPHMTALDNVAYSLKVRKVGKAERRKQAMEYLKLVQMDHLADRLPSQLSGGQQQRVALARSLITRPKVLLLDEPLSALDPFLRVLMRSELKRIQKDLGITFVHVTHSQEEAMALSDIMVVMNDGKIMQAGPARELYEQPANAFIARFIGGHNVIEREGRSVSVRADRCELVAAGGIPATVTHVEYQGPIVRVSLATDGGEQIDCVMTDGAFHAQPVKMGDRAGIRWTPADEHALS